MAEVGERLSRMRDAVKSGSSSFGPRLERMRQATNSETAAKDTKKATERFSPVVTLPIATNSRGVSIPSPVGMGASLGRQGLTGGLPMMGATSADNSLEGARKTVASETKRFLDAASAVPNNAQMDFTGDWTPQSYRQAQDDLSFQRKVLNAAEQRRDDIFLPMTDKSAGERIGLGARAIGETFASAPGVIGETTAQSARNFARQLEDSERQAAWKRAQQVGRLLDYYREAGRTHEQGYRDLLEEQEELQKKLEESRVNTAVSMDSPGMQAYGRAAQVREGALAGMEGIPLLLTEASLGAAQNAAMLPLAAINPAAPLAAMSTISAADKMYDLSSRGVGAWETLSRGIKAGFVEALTEKIPLENVLGILKTGGKSALKNVLKQAGMEATEESISYLANLALDLTAKDPEAKFSLAELGNSALIGGLSGGMMAGGSTLLNRVSTLPVRDQSKVDALPGAEGPIHQAAEQGQQKTASTGETDSTVVDTNPAIHTPIEQAVIEEYQASVDENLVNFIETALENKGSNKGKYVLHPVSDRAAGDIKTLTGIDTSGFKTVLEQRIAEHIVDRHGSAGAADQSMQDINDIARMQYVLDHYDKLEPAGKSTAYTTVKDNGRPGLADTVRYIKAVNGTYYVIEAVPNTKAKTTYIVSAYMENSANKAGAQHPVLAENGPTQTSKNANATTPAFSDPSIPQWAQGVNTEYAQGEGEDTGAAGKPGGVGPESSVGAAELGFSTPGAEGKERTSRMADATPYNQYQAEATGLTREGYDKLFRYTSQTEARSTGLANQLAYYNVDGKPVFLKDINADAYRDLTDSLKEATAWNAIQTDVANLIRQELQGRAINGEITSDEYVDWIKTMREHETATGQGVQANAKWSRAVEDGGASTEAEALENLEKSKLSEAEKDRVFKDVMLWDAQIEKAQDRDTLKKIVLDIADRRGVLSHSLTRKQSKLLTAIASKSLDTLTDEQLKSFAHTSAGAYASDIASPASIGEKIKTIQVLNMLSALTTPAKNLTGNASFYGIDALAMNGASILDMAVSKLTGTRSIAAEGSPISKTARAAARKSLLMSMAEITLDIDMGDGSGSRYGLTSNRTFKAGGNIAERLISALERNQAYLLTAPDEYFKGAARSTAEKTQKLIDSGAIKTEDAEYAKNQAEQLAKYRTFQDNSYLSEAVSSLHDILNAGIGIGDSGRKTNKGRTIHSFGAGDIVAPFTRVAGNLASRGIEYSPYNIAKGTVEIVSAVANAKRGNGDAHAQAKGVSDLARGLTGTAIALGFRFLAKAGLLRREEDEGNEDIRALNRAEGMSGVQLNLSACKRALSGGSSAWEAGDQLVDIANIEPLNLLANLGFELSKDNVDPASVASSTLESFNASVAELPVMQFIGNTATDIVKYGRPAEEVFAEEGAKTIASSLLPNIGRSLARAIDDRPRSTYSRETVVGKTIDNMKNSIPGLRETLPGTVDNYGREKVYQGSAPGRFLATMVSPVNFSTYQPSELTKELKSLPTVEGLPIFPSRNPPKSISYKDTDYTLTAEERQEYQSLYGETAEMVQTALKNSSYYQKASGEKKVELMNQARAYANDRAKRELLASKGISYQSDKWDKTYRAEKEKGIPPEVSIIYNRTKDRDGNGSVSSIEAGRAITTLPMLNNAQRGYLWQNQSSSFSEEKNPFTGTLAQNGFTPMQCIRIMEQYSAIDKEDIKAQKKDRKFKSWLREAGYTAKEIRQIRDVYTYFVHIPVD